MRWETQETSEMCVCCPLLVVLFFSLIWVQPIKISCRGFNLSPNHSAGEHKCCVFDDTFSWEKYGAEEGLEEIY